MATHNNPGDVTTRIATQQDENAVVDLWRACGLVESYNNPNADFSFALAAECCEVIVGENKAGKVCGTVMVGHDGHRGWLYYVAAAPDAQGSGIGKKMVAAAEKWLREQGVVKAQLLIRETNSKVIGFYERLGFEVTPRVVMGKFLT